MLPLPRPVGLVATDAGRRWHLGDPASADVPPEVEVRGPAASLALLLWGRASADDAALRVTGDRAVLDTVLAQPLTP